MRLEDIKEIIFMAQRTINSNPEDHAYREAIEKQIKKIESEIDSQEGTDEEDYQVPNHIVSLVNELEISMWKYLINKNPAIFLQGFFCILI